jgi:N4-gp56 family major capsid protein
LANNFNDRINLANVIGTMFSNNVVMPLRPNYVFDAVAKDRQWNLSSNPSRGDVVTFPVLSALSSNTAGLSSTVATITGSQKLTYSRKSISLTAYGDHGVLDTWEAKAETFTDDVMTLAESLSDQAMNSINKIARAVIDANRFSNGVSGTLSATYHYYGSGGTVSTMGAFKAKDVRKIVADLKADNVKPYADGFFYAIIHPFQRTQLRADSDNASWTTSSIYNANGNMLKINGDIGVFEGVRFIETSEVTKLTNTIRAFFLGSDGLGKAIGQDIRVASKSTLDGPHENLLTVYWDALLGYGILRREAVRVLSTKADKR